MQDFGEFVEQRTGALLRYAHVLTGDPVRAEFPGHVNPALKRYFQRCLVGTAFAPGPQPDAGRLLADFDRLIDALWGPRTFVPLELPAKPRPR